ncbi:MAG TPA: hypothetical protein VGP79_09325 [Bryobacteraceae bacterium]|nr:hypothetical protein [Bryobacteraceae bacterium]
MARIARAKTGQELSAARDQAGEGYGARLVSAYRWFQLQPEIQSHAENLLGLIPKTEAEQEVVLMLADALCDQASPADMLALSGVREGLSRELTLAAMRAPGLLLKYVRYSFIAVKDPHSDYAVQMVAVCQKLRPAFLHAVAQLSDEDRRFFTNRILNAQNCVAIARPEAGK